MHTANTFTRRQTLALLGAALATPLARAHPQAPLRLAAAWEQQGSFHVGLISAPQCAHLPLQASASVEVPTRAHGLCALPDGSVLAVSRRPGDWLVRWHPDRPAEPQWLWVEPDRAFNGHAIVSPDGQRIYATETDLESGASLVGVRDARSLEKLAEWPTHGIDAHELIWDSAAPQDGMPTLIVANGGVPTAAETGRAKLHLDIMDSSLVRLHGGSGERLGQWRLSDPRLSLRHLAWSPDRATLGIALQAEHDQPAEKNAAPVLALFDGQALRLQTTPQTIATRMHGYGGSIAASAHGWAVSCPRADGIATFAPQGDWQALVSLPQVCALAVDGSQLWAAGRAHSLQDAQAAQPHAHPHWPALAGARFDNHWTLLA